jgi:hypothetical protein
MIERPINTVKKVNKTNVSVEIDEIKRWFKNEYVEKLATLNRDKYLGLPMRYSRYALEMEAYEKENRMRELLGQEKLPEHKFQNII